MNIIDFKVKTSGRSPTGNPYIVLQGRDPGASDDRVIRTAVHREHLDIAIEVFARRCAEELGDKPGDYFVDAGTKRGLRRQALSMIKIHNPDLYAFHLERIDPDVVETTTTFSKLTYVNLYTDQYGRPSIRFPYALGGAKRTGRRIRSGKLDEIIDMVVTIRKKTVGAPLPNERQRLTARRAIIAYFKEKGVKIS